MYRYEGWMLARHVIFIYFLPVSFYNIFSRNILNVQRSLCYCPPNLMSSTFMNNSKNIKLGSCWHCCLFDTVFVTFAGLKKRERHLQRWRCCSILWLALCIHRKTFPDFEVVSNSQCPRCNLFRVDQIWLKNSIEKIFVSLLITCEIYI